jgi:hypothetical protein
MNTYSRLEAVSIVPQNKKTSNEIATRRNARNSPKGLISDLGYCAPVDYRSTRYF